MERAPGAVPLCGYPYVTLLSSSCVWDPPTGVYVHFVVDCSCTSDLHLSPERSRVQQAGRLKGACAVKPARMAGNRSETPPLLCVSGASLGVGSLKSGIRPSYTRREGRTHSCQLSCISKFRVCPVVCLCPGFQRLCTANFVLRPMPRIANCNAWRHAARAACGRQGQSGVSPIFHWPEGAAFPYLLALAHLAHAANHFRVELHQAGKLSTLPPFLLMQQPAMCCCAGGSSCLDHSSAGGTYIASPCACRQMAMYVLACVGYALPLAMQFVIEAAARRRFYRK